MMADAADRGLDAATAAERLARDGLNELPSAERRSPVRILVDVVREPLFALLLAAATLYLLIGDPHEALALLAFAMLSVAISVVQQQRSERVLQALRELASPQALVVRDGVRRMLPGRELVVGDLIILSEGVRVPADARLCGGDVLLLDESMLTGESVAVQKSADGADSVYSGTLVLRGTAQALVTATGSRSELGRVGASLRSIRTTVPRLERETRRWVWWFATGGIAISVLAIALYGLLLGNWTQALLGGIALAMSMLPEEFPLVLTVYLVMGAWRLSRSQVLTRRAAAIETLGSATVLCTDKTGTLTQNRMQLVQVRSDGARGDRPEEHAAVLAVALAATENPALDPMDRAVQELAAQRGVSPPAGELLRHYPIQTGLAVMARAWREPADGSVVLAAKGAPENIATLCALAPEAQAQLLQTVDDMARTGLRVLAVASAHLPHAALASELAAQRLQFRGLLGFVDPLREGVPEAVAECRHAGIRVIMITGDYPLTASAIAAQVGIAPPGVVSGPELESLDAPALAQRVRTHSIYARISPTQKLRIVQALQANGEVVAMTGDGVNDAPALKAADIGIAMSRRGTDVAREAASLVLLDDNFSSIVRAVRLGRRIYDNLRKAMGYILAIHIPIAVLALLPIVLGAPLVLTPLLIALLEMVIDPTCSIALEAEHSESDVMRRPPRPAAQRLLSLQVMGRSAAQGLLAAALVSGVFLWAHAAGLDAQVVRTMGFVAVVAVIIALLLVNRTFGTALLPRGRAANVTLVVLLLLIVGVLGTLVSVPMTQRFLQLAPLTGAQWLLSLAAGLGLLLLLELAKAIGRRGRAAQVFEA